MKPATRIDEAFRWTPQQVLNIIYLGVAAPNRGFFPDTRHPAYHVWHKAFRNRGPALPESSKTLGHASGLPQRLAHPGT